MAEFRNNRAKEILDFFKKEMQKRDMLLLRLKRLKTGANLINKISASITVTTGVSGVAISATVVMIPVTVGLETISILSGITTLISSKLEECASNNIAKHKETKLLCIEYSEKINKIIAENEDINQEEFDIISDCFEKYHQKKINLENKFN